MVYQIIRYAVLTALPDEDSRGVNVDFPNVVNIVIVDQILPIHVLGSRTITAEQDTGTTQLLNMIPGNDVFHPMQIHPNGSTATVGKVTLFDDTILGTAQTDQTLFLMRIFDIFVPIGASILAIWAVASYTITEEKAHEVRMKLEARRGT